MDSYRFFQLDVFTDKPFVGNPLAVFPEADGLTDAQMQDIAREMNLSETVFVLSSDKKEAVRRLRIFTPTQELPMAGHPVVGTWNLLARLGVLREIDEDYTGRAEILHELNIGVLPVEIDIEWGVPQQVIMTQGKFIPGEIISDNTAVAELADSLGLSQDDLNRELPVQVMETGVRSVAVPVKSLQALSSIKINSSKLSDIYVPLGAIGVYAFCLETFEPTSKVHARFFAPDDNITEDPATGSAAGALGSYLVHHGAIDQLAEDGFHRFTIEQGDFMKRPSRIHAEIKGVNGSIELTRVAGASVVVAQGEIFF